MFLVAILSWRAVQTNLLQKALVLEATSCWRGASVDDRFVCFVHTAVVKTAPEHHMNMKESYESMTLLLNLINYNRHSWKICSDLKVVAMLSGLQPGYTKYMCFLCKWDSRARKQHYIKKEWPKRTSLTLGKENIQSIPLVDKDRIILPPLHIKLGLFKNLVKALQKNGSAFQYLQSVFPNLSDAKIKEGVIVGPQIKKIIGTNFSALFCLLMSLKREIHSDWL